MTAPGKTLDLDGMEAVARAAAVRAPWRHEQYHRVLDAEGTPICKPYGKTFGEQDAYGEHIATFDPLTVLALIQTQRELVGALTEARRIAREMAAYLYPDTVAGMDREDLENVCVAAITKALGEQPL